MTKIVGIRHSEFKETDSTDVFGINAYLTNAVKNFNRQFRKVTKTKARLYPTASS